MSKRRKSRPRENISQMRKLVQQSVLAALLLLVLSACQAQDRIAQPAMAEPGALTFLLESEQDQMPPATPFATRPVYQPGELVAYTAQSGDTLPALAVRFNTSVSEILEANIFIPAEATTLPPGMPMQIPIYYLPFWGSPYQIIPDEQFVNGPAQVGLDVQTFINQYPGGWLNDYRDYIAGANRSGAEMIEYVAGNFSVSPRLLLALLEYELGALSQPDTPSGDYPLGFAETRYRGLYLQLTKAANILNNGYYQWRAGQLTTLDLPDGTIERIDPWQNAATAALHYYFAQNHSQTAYLAAIGPNGLAQTFQQLFGDPWLQPAPHLPGSLQQPEMLLPFEGGKTWAYTGGPHTGWGTGAPWAAIDFAPPAVIGGCTPSDEWATAVANGVVARTDNGVLELDLDGDGDPRTGWVVFYLHIASRNKVAAGSQVQAGDPLGHPSCEGGTSTGTHIHLARKYNGEWILAEGLLAFNLEGWQTHNGAEPYQGSLVRFTQTIIACECSNKDSQVTAQER